ncbi:MAG: hypothetical protein V5A63_18885 [Bacteroides sp.]|uniref:hypothetical protein n=1 Tax=Bacteroides sp. TaxID=29523 RepID=UPI002FC39973
MSKKLISVFLISVLVFSTVCLSGCVTPDKKFDTVKIVATVTRNGGDYTLSETGEQGYQLHVVTGTLSIEALGQTVDTQSIKTQYTNAQDNYKQYYTNMYGGGTVGSIKGWYHRLTDSDGINFNTVRDLKWSSGVNDYSIQFPTLDEIGLINYAGSDKQVFNYDRNETIPMSNFGLAIYSAKIPRGKFPNSNPTSGYVALTDPTDNSLDTGVHVTPDSENTGFLMWDGSDYRIVVLSHSPAFLKDTEQTISATVTLVKPDLESGSSTVYRDTSSFLQVYSDYLEDDFTHTTGKLSTNIDNAVSNAVSSAFSNIPGGAFVKTLDEFGDSLSEDVEESDLEVEGLEKKIKTVCQRKSVFTTSYKLLDNIFDDITWKKRFDVLGHYINLDDGCSDKDADYMSYMFTSPNVVPVLDNNPAYAQKSAFLSKYQKDMNNYLESHNLENIYRNLMTSGNTVSYSGKVFTISNIGDSHWGVFDPRTEESIKHILDFEDVSNVDTEDLEEVKEDILNGVDARVQQAIPESLAIKLSNMEENLSDTNDMLRKMNQKLLEVEMRLNDMKSFVKSKIPKEPLVEIVPYQTPTRVYTKIINKTGDFVQANPTSSFSSSCSVSVGDTKNWSMSTGYPRAVIKTQSKGTIYVTLQQDSATGSYILRKDMVGEKNLSVGDTVRTYFEAQVENATGSTLTDTSKVYYTRVQRSWLSDALNRMGLTIDDLSNATEILEEAESWMNHEESPYNGGNSSSLDNFYGEITVKNIDGNELYVKSPRKNFKMQENDSQHLVWEARIFKDEPYSINIVIGNETSSNIVSYSTQINSGEKSMWNPFNWGTLVKEYVKS